MTFLEHSRVSLQAAAIAADSERRRVEVPLLALLEDCNVIQVLSRECRTMPRTEYPRQLSKKAGAQLGFQEPMAFCCLC